MDKKNIFEKEKLDLYSFYWTEARLLIASVALFLGGIPPILFLMGNNYSSMGNIMPLLNISWIISGIVAGYMLYRWFENDKKVFDGKDQLGNVAFWVSVVSGINLGLTGIMQRNIGMSITMNTFVFWITGLIYIASAYYLYMKWKDNGKKLF